MQRGGQPKNTGTNDDDAIRFLHDSDNAGQGSLLWLKLGAIKTRDAPLRVMIKLHNNTHHSVKPWLIVNDLEEPA